MLLPFSWLNEGLCVFYIANCVIFLPQNASTFVWMPGVMRRGIICSCQAAATSKTAKALLVMSKQRYSKYSTFTFVWLIPSDDPRLQQYSVIESMHTSCWMFIDSVQSYDIQCAAKKVGLYPKVFCHFLSNRSEFYMKFHTLITRS